MKNYKIMKKMSALFLVLASVTFSSFAGDNAIGTADGSFEVDFTGMTVTGDASLVPNIGSLFPTQGSQAALMSTAPSNGSQLIDANGSAIIIEDFTVPALAATLRLDYNFLTDEPNPSYTNDSFKVELVMISSTGRETLLTVDTHGEYFEAPWTGYKAQTGFETMIADISAYAGGIEVFDLELRITDVGDGRTNSAVLVDNIMFSELSEPIARIHQNYVRIAVDELIVFDGSASSDDDGTIVEYLWDLKNGFYGIGPFVSHSYPESGIYQVTLQVTDDSGFTSTDTIQVVVGDTNTAPNISSSPVTAAAEGIAYQYPVNVDDAELAFGDELGFSLATFPVGMSIDAVTGLISWTPDSGIATKHDVTVLVTDLAGLTDSQSYIITMGPEIYTVATDDAGALYSATSLGNGSFGPMRQFGDTGSNTRGATIADYDGDGDFDVISGHGSGSGAHLYLYRRQAGQFLPAIYLDTTGTGGSYVMGMAAEDFNNDGRMDFVVDENNGNTYYYENTGDMTLTEDVLHYASFEEGLDSWGGAQCGTAQEIDTTTSATGDNSLRVYMTSNGCLSNDINPTGWSVGRGTQLTFSYRIPPGTPVGMLFNTNRGWIYLGGAPAAHGGVYAHPEIDEVVLIDDDAWHTVSLDVFAKIRQYWPNVVSISEFEWWTDAPAVTGQQFWFDDFKLYSEQMLNGFNKTLLPSAGGSGRDLDAGDANGDGNIDFIRAQYSSGNIHLYTGDGDGNFTVTQVADPGTDPYGIVLADFDSDDVLDILGNYASNGDASFFKGNGDGTFAAGVYSASIDTGTYGAFGAFDYNNDGNMDVVVTGYTSRFVRFYPGNGDGTFGSYTAIGSTSSNSLGAAGPEGRVLGQPFARGSVSADDVLENEVFDVDGTASYDDGSIVEYFWDFGDGNSSNADSASHSYTDEGVHIIVLTVTDDEGFVDRQGFTMVVYGDNPVADAGVDISIGEDSALNGSWSVRLDGTASSDSDTAIVRYEWDFDATDGVTVQSTADQPVSTYTAPGTYVVTLTVYDEVGLSNTTTLNVTVTAGDLPVAAVTGLAPIDEAFASLGVWNTSFDISGSSDDFGIAYYDIDWGDGAASQIKVLRDSFFDGNFSNPNWSVGGGSWSIVDGVLQQSSTGNTWYQLQDLTRSYTDFELEVDFKALGATDGYMGIAFRKGNSNNSTNTFMLYSRNSWNYWSFYDRQTSLVKQNGGTGWDPDVWYHLRIVVVGNNMKLYVTPEGGSESLQVETNSATHPSGGIALMAYAQQLQYDNVSVRPIASGLSPRHNFTAAGDYDVVVTAWDHANQSASATFTANVVNNDPPVADIGGPYVTTEGDAFGSLWEFEFDASGSTDDVNVERYTLDFGDGTVYTTGMGSSSVGTYFAAATDLYGYVTPDGYTRRIMSLVDGNFVEIINLDTGATIASRTVNRFAYWDLNPGVGISFKVRGTHPIVAYHTDWAEHSAFMPSQDGLPTGKEFYFHKDNNAGFFVYAYEDAAVNFYNSAGTTIASAFVKAGDYWQLNTTIAAGDYRVQSTGNVSIQTLGYNSYTTVPSSTGSAVGQLFMFATDDWNTGAFAVTAYAAADIDVFDLDSGDLLYSYSLAAGEQQFQVGLGYRRLRLVSTGDVEVWAGDTEGGSTISHLGDDISVTTGRDGTEFYLHNLNSGFVIFAPTNGTDISIDGGAVDFTLNRDKSRLLTSTDLGFSGIHHITSSQPVIIQTLGSASGFNDLGSYLGGVNKHRYGTAGDYTLTLTVTDNAGQTDTDTTTVSVTVGDAPVAAFDAPAVAGESFATDGIWTVEFDAGVASDDFEIYSYEWNFGDGGTGTGETISHGYAAEGTYDVTLIVTDNVGLKSNIVHQVEVVSGDAPVADAGGPYVFGEEYASRGVWTGVFDGRGSTDDAGLLDYRWDFEAVIDDNFSGIELDDTRYIYSAGVSQDDAITIALANGWGSQYFYSQRIFDRTENAMLQMQVNTAANAYAMVGWKNTSTSYSYAQILYALYFNHGSLNIYENGSHRGSVGSYTHGAVYDVRIILKNTGATYWYKPQSSTTWTLLYNSNYSSAGNLRVGILPNNGTWGVDDLLVTMPQYGAVTERQFTEPGVGDVTLRVRDHALQEAYDSTTFEIVAGDPPEANTGGPYTAEVGSFVAFNASASTDDNAIELFDWTFGDSTGGAADLPYTGNGVSPRHFYREVGTYTVDLTVTDNVGQSDSASTEIEVIVGDAPTANARLMGQGAVNGPPVYFDGGNSFDDYGIVEYRWDFDTDFDRDGDGDPANDIDAVGKTPFHTYSAAAIDGNFFTEDFSGTSIDTNKINASVQATQDEVLTITGAGGWNSHHVASVASAQRGRISFTGQVRLLSSGTHHMMWGLKNTSENYYYTQLHHAIYFNNGSLNIYENASSRGTVNNFTYSQGVQYDVRIDPLPTGANYYMRETGSGTWVLLAGYSPSSVTNSPMRISADIHSGQFQFDNFNIAGLGPFEAKLTVEDGAGQTNSVLIDVAIVDNLPPDVITVPWVSHDPLVAHETYNGKAIHLKGIVRDAGALTYQWNFGDGTESVVMDVTNKRNLGIVHTYPDAPTGTPFIATLKVWDAVGLMGQDAYNVIIKNQNLDTEINVSIDEGLWYLHTSQSQSSANGYPSGYWTSNSQAAATASALQSFQINGHLESSNHSINPYAETVDRGLKHLFLYVRSMAIGIQAAGEPDTNGNALGVEVIGHPIYQGGQVMDAIAATVSPLARTVTGGANIYRQSYFDILTDMVDGYSWGQTDSGASRGGWRYSWNAGADNSTAQWGAIGILGAEDIFGIPAPAFVKEENKNYWLWHSYQAGAGFGYSGASSSQAGTPSGMVQLAFVDLETSDSRWKSAETWIAKNWNTQYNTAPTNRPVYSFYAMTKAMRLAQPKPVVNFESNGFDWFGNEEKGLARMIIDTQLAGGQYAGSQWIGGQLRSAWCVIILSRTLFVQPPAADAGRDRVWAVDLALPFDGSRSYHLDPFRSIVKYEWDFDGDGIYDTDSTEPTAEFAYLLSNYPEDTLPVEINARLRVTDNNIPPLSSTDTVKVIIAIPPHPPVAESGGPYTCTAGVPCAMNGSESFDIDPTDFITSYEWELDSDFPFDFNEASGQQPSPIFTQPGQFNIGLRVWDNAVLNDVNGNFQQDVDERLSDQHFSQLTVVENIAPIAEANGPYVVNEGSAVVLSSAGSLDPNGDSISFAWDLDNDGDYDDAINANPSYVGSDDGDYTISLQVSDSDLNGFDSATVTVNNVEPDVDAGDDQLVLEGGTVNFSGGFSDPGIHDTHAISWDFGDGNSVLDTLTPSHSYPENGLYIVTLTVTDDDGGVGSDTLEVTVNNGPPVVSAGANQAIVELDTVILEPATFVDPGVLDTHTATINWGDGNSDSGTVTQGAGSGSVDGSHQFVNAGTYTVTVTVTDDDGTSGSDSFDVVVESGRPTAEANGPYVVDEGSSVALDSAGSSDPQGDPLTYAWDLDDDGNFDDSTEASPSFAGLDNGVYTVLLQVSDGVFTDVDTATVTVNNVVPKVEAGDDTLIDEGEAVNFSGSFSDAGASDTHSIEWNFGDGSAPQVGTLTPRHTYVDNGLFTVTLTVMDDDGGVGSDSLIVTVNNLAPVVEAGAGQPALIGEVIALDPASFTDAGVNDTHTSIIDWGDGNSEPGTLTQGAGSGTVGGGHSFGASAVYTVTVTVTDDDGASGSDSFNVNVETGNVAPEADAGGPYLVSEGSTQILDGTGSSDPDGDLLTYAWDLDDDGNFDDSTEASPSFAGLDDGVYTVSLQVSDGVFADVDTATVTVNNVVPEVEAGDDTAIDEGDAVNFSGSFSDAGASDTHSIEWDFGDGSAPQVGTLTPRHTYVDNGLFTVTLTVMDDDGGVGSDSLTVTVNNLAPVVEAGANQIISEGGSVVLDPASFTDAGVNDTHTAIIDWGDGSAVEAGVVTQGAGSGTVDGGHSYSVSGVYTVTVSVTDDDGGSGSDTLTVTVEAVVVVEPEQTITNLYARAKDALISVVWAPVDGAEAYNVYRSESSGGPYALIIAGHESSYATYLDTGLTNGVTYYYVVTSVSGGVESLPSNEASATPKAGSTRRTRSR